MFEYVFGALEFDGSSTPIFIDEDDDGGDEDDDSDKASGTSVSAFPLPAPVPVSSQTLLDHTKDAAYRALVQGAADTLPRLQEALFGPTIGEPIVGVLNALRGLVTTQNEPWLNVFWSRRTLTERVMDILRFKKPGATTKTTQIAAHQIVDIVEEKWGLVVGQVVSEQDFKTRDFLSPFQGLLDDATDAFWAKAETINAGLKDEIDNANADVAAHQKVAQDCLGRSDYASFYAATAKADERKTYVRALTELQGAFASPTSKSDFPKHR